MHATPSIVLAVALALAATCYALTSRCGPFLFLGSVVALSRLHDKRGMSPLLVWWLLGAVGIVVASREVDGYAQHVMGMTFPRAIDWSYVRLLLTTQAIVAAILFAILRPWSYVASSNRALVGFLVLLPVQGYLTLGLMHAPPELGFLWRWVLAGVVGCAVLIIQRSRSMRQESALPAPINQDG